MRSGRFPMIPNSRAIDVHPESSGPFLLDVRTTQSARRTLGKIMCDTHADGRLISDCLASARSRRRACHVSDVASRRAAGSVPMKMLRPGAFRSSPFDVIIALDRLSQVVRVLPPPLLVALVAGA